MSTTLEALEALEQLPALRADLATAAGVVTALEVERDALRARNAELVAALEGIVSAWEVDEIGQIDGDFIARASLALSKAREEGR